MVIAVALAVGLLGGRAQATTYTWTNLVMAAQDWNVSGNW